MKFIAYPSETGAFDNNNYIEYRIQLLSQLKPPIITINHATLVSDTINHVTCIFFTFITILR